METFQRRQENHLHPLVPLFSRYNIVLSQLELHILQINVTEIYDSLIKVSGLHSANEKGGYSGVYTSLHPCPHYNATTERKPIESDRYAHSGSFLGLGEKETGPDNPW